MPLDTLEIETGDQPRATILLLHGLGADGGDFAPLAQELDLAAVGPVRFVFPNAPEMAVTINAGYVMPAWYDIAHPDLQQQEDAQGLRRSQAAVEALLAREKARGIPASRIVLAGFSQGCAVALMTGLRHAEPLAGIAGLSGYLPLLGDTPAERHAANAGTPVFLAHGRQDDVVPISAARSARDALQSLGHAVRWHDYPMAHSVCEDEIADLNAWLLQVLVKG
jgi:phospholipase/carboxylesterase